MLDRKILRRKDMGWNEDGRTRVDISVVGALFAQNLKEEPKSDTCDNSLFDVAQKWKSATTEKMRCPRRWETCQRSVVVLG